MKINKKIIYFMVIIFISNFSYGKIIIEPDSNAHDRIQEALILAEPYENIHLSQVIMRLKMDYLLILIMLLYRAMVWIKLFYP